MRARLGRAKRRLVPNSWPPSLGPGPLPERRPGEVTGPPDFVGIGAPRSGSTWLSTLVCSHPSVKQQAWGKELHFFDSYYDREFTEEDVASFWSYFPRPAGVVTGDWTPGYMHQPWTRPMVDRAAPEALVLVALRDPVEQIRSSVNYSIYHGAPTNGLTVVRHLGEAMFASHLRLWRDLGPERLVVVQAEHAFEDPAPVIRSIWERLGIDPDVPVPRSNRNSARSSELGFSEEARRMLVEHLEPDVSELASAYEIDLSLWPNFAHLG